MKKRLHRHQIDINSCLNVVQTATGRNFQRLNFLESPEIPECSAFGNILLFENRADYETNYGLSFSWNGRHFSSDWGQVTVSPMIICDSFKLYQWHS